MNEALLTTLVVAVALGVAQLIHLARTGRLTPRQMMVMAWVCAMGLLVLILSDWPTGWMADFWSGHEILAGTVTSVLLVGVGFLVWERADQERQNALALGMSGAGFGAMVDTTIDLEVALSLLSADTPPTAPNWNPPEKPLRWLRNQRDLLDTDSDPRLHPAVLPPADPQWRMALLDQTVRRTLGAMRDWSPLVDHSELGTTALLALSDVRTDCMQLKARIEGGQIDEVAVALLTTLRQRLRVLAHFFESYSGAQPLRREVRSTMAPLPAIGPQFSWAADPSTARFFKNHRWTDALRPTLQELRRASHVPQQAGHDGK